MVRRITELRFKRALRHSRPSHLLRKRQQRGAIESFADKAGLVYFGYVDQRDDDHRLIRGHTVSATHQDNHYCIGTVRGYDVMLVLRNDVVRVPSGTRLLSGGWACIRMHLAVTILFTVPQRTHLPLSVLFRRKLPKSLQRTSRE